MVAPRVRVSETIVISASVLADGCKRQRNIVSEWFRWSGLDSQRVADATCAATCMWAWLCGVEPFPNGPRCFLGVQSAGSAASSCKGVIAAQPTAQLSPLQSCRCFAPARLTGPCARLTFSVERPVYRFSTGSEKGKNFSSYDRTSLRDRGRRCQRPAAQAGVHPNYCAFCSARCVRRKHADAPVPPHCPSAAWLVFAIPPACLPQAQSSSAGCGDV